ncbi:ral guanine nucleotide dissociation stimulator-like 1 [Pimephales promelas]|uniref:ral guanine nucleotide dissociation stimulator-like 1 n=1 Tax=Pimephales promelas TaxID=90988 RepID=UPI001955EA5D|nr:ral guanine nucleotide dissociation stimulator-like 1 [Pimephales promelas]KAG1931465.1 ral guanine nucleotide dissociation stimulator-like [Pimephales promelas]
MGKWELTMEPVQEWGEEHEEGAVFGITLRREPVLQSAEPTEGFVQYRTCKVRRLKAATLDRLVSHLVDPCCQERDYGRILLSTYHTFTSSNKLIEMLFQRDNSSLDSTSYRDSCLWTLLQMWLDEYSDDFRDPPMHSSLRLMCLQLRGHPFLFPLAKHYEALLKKFQTEDVVADCPVDYIEEPGLNKEANDIESDNLADFMDFSITDVAEQLTRMDTDLFMKVVPFQCLGCVWSQRDKNENLSPTVWATITQFNAVTNWVITSLLHPSSSASSSTTTERARAIEKWVRVAQGCRELKNFSSLKAILSALQSNPIYRLRKTWSAVSREAVSVFENLSKTFPDENCVLTSREMFLDSSAGGTVPYLGTYLTVLNMLDTALPDTVEGGLINFEKRRREFEILRQIRQLQALCSQYVLPRHPQIAAWLQSQKLLSDQESYELSRQLESPHDTSPSNSGWSHQTLTKKLSSLLSGNEGSRKNADQISVSSSGSSSSEIEESTNTAKVFPSSSSPDSSTMSSSSSSSQQDLCLNPSSSSSSSPASANPHLVSCHKRSFSMTTLPFYNRQVDDSCIIRVSVEFCNNGNMYKSILLTSQDKTAQVIQRALQKHNLEDVSEQDFSLVQVLAQGRELHIPEKANVFYAMSTSANYDFVLRRCPKGQRKQLIRSVSLSSGRATK